MQPLERLLVDLADGVASLTDVGEGHLRVDGAELAVPLEGRAGEGATLLASLPRGRMATGFHTPHGRLRLRLTGGKP